MGDLNNPNENNEQQPNDQNADQSQYQQQQYQQQQYQQPLYQQPQNQQSQYQQTNPNQSQNQYQQYQQYQQPLQPRKDNGMAIAAMVCGIVSFVFSCCLWYLALPLAIVGLVLSIIVIKNKKDGKGMAIAGIVLSSITIIIAIIAIFAVVLFANNESFMSEFYNNFSDKINTTEY
ncbi:MAG: hypothetical protein K0S01_1535 [Herbinix sp.]|jgi:thiol:disulfide interchange protein|nr:hypothetical protein [Herbinix sp.]